MKVTITDEVIDQIAGAKIRRIKQIGATLVRHLHAFIRGIKPIEPEWIAGISYLTEAGYMCNEERQEFIPTDSPGVCTVADANHQVSRQATETFGLEPFDVNTSQRRAPRVTDG